MENDNNTTYKILLLGEDEVGKRSILDRYIEDIFDKDYLGHMPACYSSKKITINNQVIILEIWEPYGTEIRRAVPKLFYNGASAVIFVFDITKLVSFEELKKYWYKAVEDNLDIKNIGKIYFFLLI